MNIDLSRAIEVLQACGYECDEITSMRQQLTAALDEARMAKVSADEVRSTYAEEMRKLSQQLASRDAEVAELREYILSAHVLLSYRQGTSNDVPKKYADEAQSELEKALAATEPKP